MRIYSALVNGIQTRPEVHSHHLVTFGKYASNQRMPIWGRYPYIEITVAQDQNWHGRLPKPGQFVSLYQNLSSRILNPYRSHKLERGHISESSQYIWGIGVVQASARRFRRGEERNLVTKLRAQARCFYSIMTSSIYKCLDAFRLASFRTMILR